MTDSLSSLIAGFRSGTAKPSEITKDYLEKIDLCEDASAIFRVVTKDLALKQAEASDRRYDSGTPLSAIDGIPLAWKDNIQIAGFSTSAGVPKLAEQISDTNSTIYERSLSAGAVCLGKTNMNELAFSGLGVNRNFGTPRNPFDEKIHRIPGGSSAGSAVAVSRGISPAAIGTDTGGSVRIPAAWNNLVGLKTTAGLLPTNGVIPLSQSLDTIGFLTHNVFDSALLYEVFSGTKIVDLEKCSIKGMTFIDCQNIVRNQIDIDVEKTYTSALSRLQDCGAIIKSLSFPEIDEVFDISAYEGNIITYEANINWADFIEENPGAISPEIEARINMRQDLTIKDIELINKKVRHLRDEFLKRASDGFAVIMPTVAFKPPTLAEILESADAFAKANMMALRNTRIANLLGLCAISLPAGFTKDGFPVGIMLNSAPFSEVSLLRVAKAVESTLARR